MKDEDEEVDAREGACSMETAMVLLKDDNAWAASSEAAEERVF